MPHKQNIGGHLAVDPPLAIFNMELLKGQLRIDPRARKAAS